IVIIIDALDESGRTAVRRKLLTSLASLAVNLPSTVRILITTRPEPDIVQIIKMSPQLPNVSKLYMDDLPNQSTKDDIHQYIKYMLEGPLLNADSEQLAQLAERAQLSFQWASTACHHIVNHDDGNQAVLPYERLRNTLSSFGATSSLDNLYSTVMDAQFGQSDSRALEIPRLLLGVLVVVKKPISLHTMLQLLHAHLSLHYHLENPEHVVGVLLGCLSSLITGTRVSSANGPPLLPLHTSFLDFLQNPTSNPKYWIDVSKMHQILTESCFAIMQSGERKLIFNICKLPTSFLPNSSIPGLDMQIQEKIGQTLSYACHYWASHLQASKDIAPRTLDAVKSLLSTDQFLYWLEVMSLTGASPVQSLSLISAQLNNIKANPRILEYVLEALHFSTHHAIPITQSVPHIYLSAVPFIPRSSPLHALSEQFKKTMSISSGNLGKWPALRHVLRHQSAVQSMAISRYGVVGVGLSDGAVLLWDSPTGQQYKHQPIGHTGAVSTVVFSPDGALLGSGSSDKTIQLWDVYSQAAKGDPLIGHSGSVRSLAFSADGTVLASGSYDRTVWLWDTQSQPAKGDPLRGQS
ncbi:hypothetical protein DL93DRAFT_2037009, partial [Clavulina sp. PMI_390]